MQLFTSLHKKEIKKRKFTAATHHLIVFVFSENGRMFEYILGPYAPTVHPLTLLSVSERSHFWKQGLDSSLSRHQCSRVVRALGSSITQPELGHSSACRCRGRCPALAPGGGQTPRRLERRSAESGGVGGGLWAETTEHLLCFERCDQFSSVSRFSARIRRLPRQS